MSEWDTAKKILISFISECNCMSSEDYKEAFASVAVGDKLLEEAEGHKARYDDLHRITVKWQKKIELIQKIAEKDISARLSRYPNTEKTPLELLDMVLELKERHSKILWVLSLD